MRKNQKKTRVQVEPKKLKKKKENNRKIKQYRYKTFLKCEKTSEKLNCKGIIKKN